MFSPEPFARYLLAKGCASGSVGSVYWLGGEWEYAAALLTIAILDVLAAWAVARMAP